jgi:hypothetical protein
MFSMGGHHKNVRAIRLKIDLNTKLQLRATIIILGDQIRHWIRWIKRMMIKVAPSVDITTACKNIGASCGSSDSYGLEIIVIVDVALRSVIHWAAER